MPPYARLSATHDYLRRWGTRPGWASKQLGELAHVVGGGTPSRDDRSYWDQGHIHWATPTDITANSGKWISTTAERVTDAGLRSSAASLLPERSVLFTSRATIGAKAIASAPMATNQGFASFVPKACDPEFLYYMLELLTPVIQRLGAGTTFLEVSKRDVRKVWCAVPACDEQVAIARVLDAVDEAIEAARSASERSLMLKRALMQDLLPPWIGLRELSTEQTPAGVEEIARADSVADVSNGSTPSRGDMRYWRDGAIPWLPTGKVHDRVITAPDEFVTDAALRECSIRLLPVGTVLVGMIGQGRTRGMSAYLGIEACINQNFGAFTPRTSPKRRVEGKWLFYYLDYHYSRVRELGGGTNQGALNCYLLKRLRIPLPTVDRQQEVARVLDGVEALEHAHRAALGQLAVLKRSLLHDLLTGTVRIPATLIEELSRP